MMVTSFLSFGGDKSVKTDLFSAFLFELFVLAESVFVFDNATLEIGSIFGAGTGAGTGDGIGNGIADGIGAGASSTK